MKCDYCKKEIEKNASGFLEEKLSPFLFKYLTGLPGDNRLGNYFVCHGLSCKQKMTQELFDEFAKNADLFDADPECKHEIVDAPGGGVKCTKCTGWFCF